MKLGLLLALKSITAVKFTNDFILKFWPNLTDEHIDEIAQKNGYINQGRINDEYWHFISPRLKRRGTHYSFTDELITEPAVRHVKQLKVLSRVKRDYTNGHRQNSRHSRRKKDFGDELRSHRHRRRKRMTKFDTTHGPNDPLYGNMWYINPAYHPPNQPQRDKFLHGDALRHMNVTGAWSQGYSGKNIVVTILDDGVEKDHPDLRRNYLEQASWDINNDDNDPTPRYNPSNENRHGTRCAGQVGAAADNNLCVPGIAFNSRIGGIRMLDGDVTDLVESRSIYPNHKKVGRNEKTIAQHIDIYSASWGPDDDGKTVDGPAELARKAFREGTTNGRDRRGSIYIWASGNGGRYKDNCNCDGYINSIYTISVSSTSEQETIPWYSEPCSSTLASTYSSGNQTEKQIMTTDLRHQCTSQHTGTSASAPMAAAIVALALEANPNVGWRDMQHIIVRTSKRHLLKADDWSINGVGREFSHRYGYGLLDAGAMTETAKNWRNVPKVQRVCSINVLKTPRNAMPPAHGLERKNSFELRYTLKNDDCIEGPIDRLEHVIAKITMKFDHRGRVKVFLTSPAGTRSMILGERAHDYSSKGFQNFPFMTVHFWDEAPYGEWILNVHSTGPNDKGILKKFELVIHGTGDDQWTEDDRNLRGTDSSFDSSSESIVEEISVTQTVINNVSGESRVAPFLSLCTLLLICAL